MAAVNTKGQKLSFTTQSAFETINTTTPKDFRPEGEIKVGSSLSESVTPQEVFADAHMQSKPVVYGSISEDAVTFSTDIRQAASAGGTPSLVSAMLAGGWSLAATKADTTIATYASSTSWTLTADETAAGTFGTVELVDGRWLPVLISGYTQGTKTCVPLVALPAASLAGKAFNKCFTLTPGQPGPIAVDKFLSLFYATRANDSNRSITGTACWLKSMGDITFEPGKQATVELTFASANWQEGTTGSITTANDFADSDAVKIVDAPIVQFVTYSASGAIATASAEVMKAVVKFNVMAEPIVGMGSTACVNNCQGAMKIVGPCEISIDALFQNQKITDWEGTNPTKTIVITQPSTSETVPSFAVAVPRAHIMEAIPVDYGGNAIKMSIKYTGLPAALGGVTTPGAQTNQPIYFGIGDRSA